LSKNGVRGRVYVATKLPIANCKSGADFDVYFNKQLASLNTDYIDYYLMHNINSLAQWEELCAWGIREWIGAQKASGVIRQIGFSFHGARDEFKEVLAAYDWEFCQIQYNYANENYQAGVTGLKAAAERHIPVIVMEPLLGGKLANGLSPAALSAFRKVDKDRTPAAWGLRWLWNQPEVTVVLSGMNDPAQLTENLQAADEASAGMLTEEELSAYGEVLEIFKQTDKIPCTGCSYCMPCPAGVNIPACFASYNASYTHGRITSLSMYITSTAANRNSNALASNCIECGKCESHCPQKIEIRRSLKDVAKRMEPLYFKIIMKFMRSRGKRKQNSPENA
jgi:predicted aldo/keto reductase-like oxidoreductase